MNGQTAKATELAGSAPADASLRLGISSCLLGQEVRYNGGHKRDSYLVNTLGPFVQWYPVCPEVEIGLGTPRETIRLEGDPLQPRLVAPGSGTDLTETMQAWARSRLDAVASWRLHGYVFKKDSPSCGLFRVRVYGSSGVPTRDGRGVFARLLTARFPLLPVEEEGRLRDPLLRENFIERLFIYERWLRFIEHNASAAGLVEFHTAHKMTLLAHHPHLYRELGRLVAQAGSLSFEDLVQRYSTAMAEATRTIATRGRHRNVLQHLLGFFKDSLDAGDRAEISALIDDYAAGLVPLVVPVTLLRHHARRRQVPEWFTRQVYLNPYPRELMLRNHV